MSTGKFWFSLILPDEHEPVPDDDHSEHVQKSGESARRDGETPEAHPAEQDTVSTETSD